MAPFRKCHSSGGNEQSFPSTGNFPQRSINQIVTKLPTNIINIFARKLPVYVQFSYPNQRLIDTFLFRTNFKETYSQRQSKSSIAQFSIFFTALFSTPLGLGYKRIL